MTAASGTRRPTHRTPGSATVRPTWPVWNLLRRNERTVAGAGSRQGPHRLPQAELGEGGRERGDPLLVRGEVPSAGDAPDVEPHGALGRREPSDEGWGLHDLGQSLEQQARRDEEAEPRVLLEVAEAHEEPVARVVGPDERLRILDDDEPARHSALVLGVQVAVGILRRDRMERRLDVMERSVGDVREWLAFRERRERPPLWTPRSLS